MTKGGGRMKKRSLGVAAAVAVAVLGVLLSAAAIAVNRFIQG